MNVHSFQDRLSCPYAPCPVSIVGRGKFETHLINVHIKCRPYSCQMGCSNATYNDNSNLRAHYKKTHGKVITTPNIPLEKCWEMMNEVEAKYHRSIVYSCAKYVESLQYVGGKTGRKKTKIPGRILD